VNDNFYISVYEKIVVENLKREKGGNIRIVLTELPFKI